MKKIQTFLLLPVLIGCMLSTSCKKSGNDDNPIDPAPAPLNADVYVAGSELNEKGVVVAKLWKNGTAYNISDGTKNAGASGVFVRGTDVYVSFTEGARKRAKLWKNGTVSTLYFPEMNDVFAESGASGMCNGVVAGYYTSTRAVAVYWDDNGVHQVSNPSAYNADAYAIHIKTINNYTRTSICGQKDLYNSLASRNAFVWGGQFSNPSLTNLGGTQFESIGRTCFINDNGFTYTGGREVQPTIWFENGATMKLSPNTGSVNGLFVVGYTNVFAAGEELVNGRHIAKLWSGDYLSGTLKATNLSDPKYEASAYGIQVIDGNTFIAGNEFEIDGKSYAKYWKNRVAVKVGGPNSYAAAIFVVKK